MLVPLYIQRRKLDNWRDDDPPPRNTRWRYTSLPLVNTTLTSILTNRKLENHTALFISYVMLTFLWIRCPLPLRAFFCYWISWIFLFWNHTPAPKRLNANVPFLFQLQLRGPHAPASVRIRSPILVGTMYLHAR